MYSNHGGTEDHGERTSADPYFTDYHVLTAQQAQIEDQDY